MATKKGGKKIGGGTKTSTIAGKRTKKSKGGKIKGAVKNPSITGQRGATKKR